MEYFPEILSSSRSPLFTNPLRNFEDIFTSAFKPWMPMQRFAAPTIPLDIVEFADKYIVKADLPGVERKCVDISFENGTLLLKVEMVRDEEKKDAQYLTRERLFSSTARSIPLPLADAKGAIDAVMKEGVLRITVPKQVEKHTKKIEIH